MAKTKAVEEKKVSSVKPVTRTHGGTLQTDDLYLFCNLKNVKETFVGRGQSVLIGDDLPNGTLTFLGDEDSDNTHIYEASDAGQADVTNMPWVLFRPEIVANECSMMNKVIGEFRMKAGKPQPAWQLNLLDKIEYSQDYFVDTPAVGDFYELPILTGLFEAKNPGAAGIVFKVVSTHEVQTPVAYFADANLPGLPESRIMYTLQVVNKA